jgi:hypothetical protein
VTPADGRMTADDVPFPGLCPSSSRLLSDSAKVVRCRINRSRESRPFELRLAGEWPRHAPWWSSDAPLADSADEPLLEPLLVVTDASSVAILAVGELPVYCPRTFHKPTREVDPQLKDWLLERLADGFVQTVFLPFIILGVAFVAELAASTRPWTHNDATIGFDLLFAAAGSHVAVLGAANGLTREHAYVRVDMRFAVLTGLMLTIIAVVIWILLRGTESSGNLKLYEGVIIPSIVGFAALVATYWLDFKVMRAS